jgi:heparosan-N-sulfate-glucuronate 5-epimerase
MEVLETSPQASIPPRLSRGRSRLSYYRRIFAAYLTSRPSQLTFWHETPEVNEGFRASELGEYYMPFTAKADYGGQFDDAGIPMLHYQGMIGLQYNPIAIAQYGLGNYNLYRRQHKPERRTNFLRIADWMVLNLQPNWAGLKVWNHAFDWEYRTTLVAPWYSGLAQGQGISLLVRAFAETGDATYMNAARAAFEPMLYDVSKGGVTATDGEGNLWIEEYIVHPDSPTHILNGFIWATWGIYDYWLATREASAKDLFDTCVKTIARNLHRFDTGYWSLYEQSGTRMKMLASPFYHRLHITELRVLHRLTGEEIFAGYADRWAAYARSWLKRNSAIIHKAVFKLCYY